MSASPSRSVWPVQTASYLSLALKFQKVRVASPGLLIVAEF